MQVTLQTYYRPILPCLKKKITSNGFSENVNIFMLLKGHHQAKREREIFLKKKKKGKNFGQNLASFRPCALLPISPTSDCSRCRGWQDVAAPPGICLSPRPLVAAGFPPRAPAAGMQTAAGMLPAKYPNQQGKDFSLAIKKELTHMHQGWVLLPPPSPPAHNKNLKLNWQCPFAQNKDFRTIYRLDIEANSFTGWKSQVHCKIQVFKPNCSC